MFDLGASALVGLQEKSGSTIYNDAAGIDNDNQEYRVPSDET
jgi:hypothetical protein